MPTAATNSAPTKDLHDAPRATEAPREETLAERRARAELETVPLDDSYDLACTD
jgi:hypothetical protein